MNKLNWTQLFFLSYLCSLALAKWWNLPVLGYKFQLPEVLFLLGIVFVFLGKIPFRWRAFDRLDWGISAFVILSLIGALGGNWKASLPGGIGWIYLYIAYLLFSRIPLSETGDLLKLSAKGWLGCATLASLIGILGYGAWVLGWSGDLVHEKYLPYLGSGARAASLVRNPDVMVNLILYALLFYGSLKWATGKNNWHKEALVIGPILGIGLLLSFSKFLILVPTTLLLLWSRLNVEKAKWVSFSISLLAIIVTAFFLLATHFFTLSRDEWSADKGKMEAFITENIVWEGQNYLLVETAYLPLKRQATKAGWEHLPFGQGIGQFPEYLEREQQAGRAAKMPAYDTHSSYWGLWAEAGLLGAIGGVIFLVCLFSYLWEWGIKKKTMLERAYWVAVSTMLIYIVIEGLVLDGLHFRHHWMLLVFISWGRNKLT